MVVQKMVERGKWHLQKPNQVGNVLRKAAMTQRIYTDFLAADGSVLIGAANSFNLGGNFFHHNKCRTPAQADAVAIRQDFAIVGGDVGNVVHRLRRARQLNLQLKLE